MASPVTFDPLAVRTLRFGPRQLGADGEVRLRYALDDGLELVERFTIPVPAGGLDPAAHAGALALLHWAAGVSYYKMAAPPAVAFDGAPPPPAAARWLEALYSEGLGEFAVVNGLAALPRPSFAVSHAATEPLGDGAEAWATGPTDAGRGAPPATARPPGDSAVAPAEGGQGANATGEAAPASASARRHRAEAPLDRGDRAAGTDPRRVLVPVGGGKDSIVALEAARRAADTVGLFSVGTATPIERTVRVAGLPWLTATRRLDPQIGALNAAGALNGHVPVTAIVSCVALLVASVHGYDAVALANERSASSGNLVYDGVEVNHQFSKGRRAERLLSAAVAEAGLPVRTFSLLRPASELGIARAFAGLTGYHAAFTSCNRMFHLDPALRAASWCGDCDKCRFVFLILAPFLDPGALETIFGHAMLDDAAQFAGFALLAADGGHKPFECVGTEDESVAAMRLLAADPRWRDRPVVRRLRDEVLAGRADGDPAAALALSDDHDVPPGLLREVRALLGA